MQKGGIVSDTLEKLGELAKDSGKAVANEPLKILQQALGVDADGNSGADPLEQGASSSTQQLKQQQQNQAQSNQLLMRKKMEDRDRVQQLLQLHRQRLKEEEAFFEQTEAEEKHKEQVDEQQKHQEEQERIVQLQRQEAKDAVLSAQGAQKGPRMPGAVKQAQKLRGTQEIGKSKAD